MTFRILLDSTTDLDMPPEMTTTSNYCASLGHKVVLDVMVIVMSMVAMMLNMVMIVMILIMFPDGTLCYNLHKITKNSNSE